MIEMDFHVCLLECSRSLCSIAVISLWDLALELTYVALDLALELSLCRFESRP